MCVVSSHVFSGRNVLAAWLPQNVTMLRDISSSSEDEADDHPQRPPTKPSETNEKSTRYQCPGNFAYFCHKPCSSTLRKSLKNNKTELWLIKAPANFNPECLSGVEVPLSGLQKLKFPAAESKPNAGGGQQVFSVLASNHGTADLCLLTSDKKSSNGMVFGPAFSGLLNVCESYESTNQASHVIPAAPAPSIPPGLKRRFHHFGSKPLTAASVAESETDGATLGLSSSSPCPSGSKRLLEEMEEEGRKKKKKKKERQMKVEREEESLQVVRVKVEPGADVQDEVMAEVRLHEGDAPGEKRKKKKKKKDRDQEAVEERMEPSVKVEDVKCEQIDNLYGDVVEAGQKKKKKKKKSKTDSD